MVALHPKSNTIFSSKVLLNMAYQYRNTFSRSTQIILFSLLLNLSKKNLKIENLENSIKAAIFEPMTNSTK
jgi:hypothetical protein